MTKYVKYVLAIDSRLTLDQGPVGVFIHPSAYLIYDREFLISTNSRDWSFQEEFCNFRRKVVSREAEKVWEQSSEAIDENIKKVRILVCGPAGVGKSSILNKVLGVTNLVSSHLI
jgi:ribosome biogenesis GTPase A